MSAGNWPESPAMRTERLQQNYPSHHLSHRIHLNRQTNRAEFQYSGVGPRIGDSPYIAQLLKTVDAGKTWTSQFADVGYFYFNRTHPFALRCLIR